jgi:hypothetical protein
VVAPDCINQGQCQLAPATTIVDYVLMHTGYMGPRKLSSFDGHRVGRYLTSLHGSFEGIVFGPPTDYPVRFSRGRRL